MGDSSIIGIKPLEFVHIIDYNTNVTFVEHGPKTVVLQSNEKLVLGPSPFIVVPPGHYCLIKDPIKKYIHKKPIQVKHGCFDVRFHKKPFLLYPGETLIDSEVVNRTIKYTRALKLLPVIGSRHGLLLHSRVDHKVDGVRRYAGDIWQVEGPMTYYPTPQAEILSVVAPHVIKHGEALRLKATQDTRDHNGKLRVTGEEWQECRPGAYLPGVCEKVMTIEKPYTLNDSTALHLRAVQNITDNSGRKRQAGDEWLITSADVESYIPPIGVEVEAPVPRIVLSKNEYSVILNPVDEKGQPQLGKKVMRHGICSFFLNPGEKIEDPSVRPAYVLGENEAVVLAAEDRFIDTISTGEKVQREPGERWMIHGPTDYIPSIEVKVIDRRKAIPLSKNEGVYVRHIKSGAVRSVMGPCAYLLTEDEVFFHKELPSEVEEMLKKGGGIGSADIRKLAYFEQSIDPTILKGRNKTRVVTFRCPGNTACQVYNYRKKTARVIFGPDLVILEPHENFNVLSLSAGKPKKPDALKCLCLMLGPDFITDIMEVETSDHARLRIKLAFNNYFLVDKSDPESAKKVFSVPDFIGFACRQVAGRIRGAVAQVPFDEFHKHSSQLIQHAVVGTDENGVANTQLTFQANDLVVSNVDIQSIEPVDAKMRDSLMKSVQMAIEIATRSIEAAAENAARCVEQVARGRLERQKLANEADAEKERAILYELRAITAAVESAGQAVAEAQAQAEKNKIECESEIEVATLKARAAHIEHAAQLESEINTRSGELEYRRQCDELEINRLTELSNIEIDKFTSIVDTLGVKSITAIARSGHENQVKMLEGLGLESTLFTDGNSPINLFRTSQGLLGL